MNIESMIGKTFSNVYVEDRRKLVFENDKEIYTFYHEQDCCETVSIEDVTGDLKDLIDSPITFAEKSSSSGESEWGTAMYTFYKFATFYGWVDIRWFGESNGYYSESVDLEYKVK